MVAHPVTILQHSPGRAVRRITSPKRKAPLQTWLNARPKDADASEHTKWRGAGARWIAKFALETLGLDLSRFDPEPFENFAVAIADLADHLDRKDRNGVLGHNEYPVSQWSNVKRAKPYFESIGKSCDWYREGSQHGFNQIRDLYISIAVAAYQLSFGISRRAAEKSLLALFKTLGNPLSQITPTVTRKASLK